MNERVKCPGCGAGCALPRGLYGKEVCCPRCRRVFVGQAPLPTALDEPPIPSAATKPHRRPASDKPRRTLFALVAFALVGVVVLAAATLGTYFVWDRPDESRHATPERDRVQFARQRTPERIVEANDQVEVPPPPEPPPPEPLIQEDRPAPEKPTERPKQEPPPVEVARPEPSDPKVPATPSGRLIPFDEEEHGKSVKIDPKAKFVAIDLKRYVNWARDEDVFTRGHNMGDVPRGKTTLADVPFELANEGALLLGGHRSAEKKWPSHLSGIAVDAKFARLHVFHTSHYWSRGKGTRIGCYRLHYEGGDWAELPIVYGRDLADWCDRWQPEDGRTRLGWAGKNGYHAIRFYATAYDNPRPERKVVSIDFISDGASACPCCVAMTLEGP